jgi:hypothetical protein
MNVAIHKMDFSVEIILDAEQVRLRYGLRQDEWVVTKGGDPDYGNCEQTFSAFEVSRVELRY